MHHTMGNLTRGEEKLIRGEDLRARTLPRKSRCTTMIPGIGMMDIVVDPTNGLAVHRDAVGSALLVAIKKVWTMRRARTATEKSRSI